MHDLDVHAAFVGDVDGLLHGVEHVVDSSRRWVK